ncbi:MAG: aminodeoxychorismate/anthranilate synthase component II [Deltaproteobacteria bacterium]|nr:aminodeoxychorismate/anthranilate synthase component II [Deltaproteobacteria bacterium]
MVRVFLLDNVDSFTYNLAQGLEQLGAVVQVVRASSALTDAIAAFVPTHLVLSPGPLRPADHPAIFTLLERFAGRLPMLGVCLGMQAINEYCGGGIRRDTHPMHGKTSAVIHDGHSLFADVPTPFSAARYHSLRCDPLGQELHATAWTSDRRIVMALQHTTKPLFGLQFHPESYLTPDGLRILRNFLAVGGNDRI